VRGKRRFDELMGRGEAAELAQVIEDVRARDERDAERVVAPMKAADDAQTIDTSDLSIAEAIAAAISAVEAVRGTA
jgi:cytidylate kinase